MANASQAAMERAVDSLKGNEAWRRLEKLMDDEFLKTEVDLQVPGEFEHGRAIGKRYIINLVLGFPVFAVDNPVGSGPVEIWKKRSK